MKKLYECEVCGKVTGSAHEIEMCEQKHEIERKAKTMPAGAVLCPSCKGVGGHDGSDGCDFYACGDCKGVGFVMPVKSQTVEVMTYRTIEIKKS